MATNAGFFSDSEEHRAVEEWREDEDTYDWSGSPILGFAFSAAFSAVFAAVFRVDDLESAENLAIIAILFLLGAAIWIFLNGGSLWRFCGSRLSSYFFKEDEQRDHGFQRNVRGNPPEQGLCGLRNLGNTCYMNSALQCLSASSAMRQLYLHVIDETSQGEKGTHKLSIYKNSENGKRIGTVESKVLKYSDTNPEGSGGIISTQFAALLQNMWNDEFEVFAPTGFKKIFGKRHGRFAMYLQEDANEFLVSLLRDLHEDLNCASNRKIRQRGDSFDHLDNQEREKRMDAEYRSQNRSPILDLFCGQTRSLLCCTECERQSSAFEPMWTLELAIPDTQIWIEPLLVMADVYEPPVQFGLAVPKTSSVRDVATAISDLVAEHFDRARIDPDTLRIGLMTESCEAVARLLDENLPMPNIDDVTQVWVFE
eukprot:g5456.t1